MVLGIAIVGSHAFRRYDRELEELEFDNADLEDMEASDIYVREENADVAKCRQQVDKAKAIFANCMKKGKILFLPCHLFSAIFF